MIMVNLFKDLSYALSGDMFNTNEPAPFTMPEGDVYIYDNHPQFISFHTSADTFEEDNL
jgi:hypothetical protein